MPSLSQLGEQILKFHSAQGRKLPELLNPGLAEAEVADLLQQHGMAPVEGVVKLYSWRDGTQEGVATYNDMWIFPGYYIYPLQRACQRAGEMAEDLPTWELGWLPVFCSGSGGYIAVDCRPGSKELGSVIDHTGEGIDPKKEYDNLNVMFQRIVTAIDKGIIFLEDEKWLEMDDKKFRALK